MSQQRTRRYHSHCKQNVLNNTESPTASIMCLCEQKRQLQTKQAKQYGIGYNLYTHACLNRDNCTQNKRNNTESSASSTYACPKRRRKIRVHLGAITSCGIYPVVLFRLTGNTFVWNVFFFSSDLRAIADAVGLFTFDFGGTDRNKHAAVVHSSQTGKYLNNRDYLSLALQICVCSWDINHSWTSWLGTRRFRSYHNSMWPYARRFLINERIIYNYRL
jgi:hypothetical protein